MLVVFSQGKPRYHPVVLRRAETLHVSIVEAALLRPWPGNVRELLSATVAAATQAREPGGAVKASHLGSEAGVADEREPQRAETPALAARTKPEELSEEVVVAALSQSEGNATLAAKKLGLHRTQLSRLRKKFGLSVAKKK